MRSARSLSRRLAGITVLALLAAALALVACGDDEGGSSADGDDGGDAVASSCPAGTAYHEGACIETELRPEELSWSESNQLCLSEGRRIPDLAELQTFLPTIDGDPDNLEWQNLRYRAGEEELAGLVSAAGEIELVSADEAQTYRCVASPEAG